MAVILEVKDGPAAGKRVAAMVGQTITVGRAADRATLALPHDTFMSAVHFAVECGPNGCRLVDKKSSNGTFVNGARVREVPLCGGEEIRGGQTVFMVRMVEEAIVPTGTRPAAPARPLPTPVPPPTERTVPLERGGNRVQHASPPVDPQPSLPLPVKRMREKPLLRIGGWTFSHVPEQWTAQGEYGIQRDSQDAFPSSAVVTEEPLSNGVSLQKYVEAQLAMLHKYLREPRIEAVLPPPIAGAEEIAAIDVHYSGKDGGVVVYQRIYVRVGQMMGVLTFTTIQNELKQVQPSFDAIVAGAEFAPQSRLRT